MASNRTVTQQHLSKSILLEETGSPFIMRMILFSGGLLIGLFLYWSNVAKLDEVSVALGEVIPTSQVRKIQHPEGGVVEKITIREGQFVTKGETAIWLRSTEHQAKVDVQRVLVRSLEAKKARLSAFVELINESLINIGSKNESMSSKKDKIVDKLIHSATIEGALFESQIRQVKADLQVLDGSELKLFNQQKSLQRELAVREILVMQDKESKVSLIPLKRQLKRVSNDLSQIPGKRKKLFVDLQTHTLSQLTEVERTLSQSKKLIQNYQARIYNTTLKIPVTGLVHKLLVQSPGDVIPAGATIFEIVPNDKDMLAEVKITPKDIGHVHISQSAIMKFTAYDFSRYGSLSGQVISISPTTFLDTKGQPYYKGTVSLEKAYFGKDPAKNLIIPGMTVEANIKTGSKTILQYLLKPIFASSQQALRER